MATWITHMRIAEYFMNIDNQLNRVDFLVGNIAPDCGVWNEEGGKFIPDKKITHWKLDGKNTDAEDFKSKYVKKAEDGYSFYLGYYFHLLTDIEWKKFFQKTIEIMNSDRILSGKIKKDWYGQDFLFLQNNPNSVFYSMFSKIKEYDNRYFDFYPKDAFSKQIQHITNSYLSAEEDIEREFTYLPKSEMDSFIDKIIIYLKEIYYTL